MIIDVNITMLSKHYSSTRRLTVLVYKVLKITPPPGMNG
jgi:hypothetical protein